LKRLTRLEEGGGRFASGGRIHFAARSHDRIPAAIGRSFGKGRDGALVNDAGDGKAHLFREEVLFEDSDPRRRNTATTGDVSGDAI
jgi:hypothetical protein